MHNIAENTRKPPAVFGVSLITAFILFFLVIIAGIIWTQTLEPYHIQVNKTIRATEVAPKYEIIKEEQTLTYPDTVFESNYAYLSRKTSGLTLASKEIALESSSGIKKEERFHLLKADKSQIPAQYTEIQYPYMEYPVYAFMDKNGVIQYRVYAERTQNNHEERGYLVSTQVIENMRIKMKYDEASAFVHTEEEPFGSIIPENAPDEKTYGLLKEYGKTGIYYRINKDGSKEYYAYGHYKNEPSEFYLADNTGTMIPGTLPLVNINDKEDK